MQNFPAGESTQLYIAQNRIGWHWILWQHREALDGKFRGVDEHDEEVQMLRNMCAPNVCNKEHTSNAIASYGAACEREYECVRVLAQVAETSTQKRIHWI